jgi:hypothetical protein
LFVSLVELRAAGAHLKRGFLLQVQDSSFEKLCPDALFFAALYLSLLARVLVEEEYQRLASGRALSR